MTMTACHPKYSASQRYVVFARLVRVSPRADGLPASIMVAPLMPFNDNTIQTGPLSPGPTTTAP